MPTVPSRSSVLPTELPHSRWEGLASVKQPVNQLRPAPCVRTEPRLPGRKGRDRQERAGPARPPTRAPAFGFWLGRCLTGAARERHERAPGPVTVSGMACGSATGGKPKHPRDCQRLLLILLAGRCGSLGGRGVLARRYLSAFPGGPGVLRPRVPAARGSASRASALLLLVLVPSPRLAAAAPRRPLGDWERSRPGASAPLAGHGGAWRCQPGRAPGFACAAGALHLCPGRVAALASSRRGRAGRVEVRAPSSRGWGRGARRALLLPLLRQGRKTLSRLQGSSWGVERRPGWPRPPGPPAKEI